MLWKFILISLISLSIAHLAFLGRRNMIVLVLVIEIMFMTISITFATFYYEHVNDLPNHDALFAAFAIIVISAAETAVLLALLSRLFRKTRNIMVKDPTEDGKKKKSK